MKFEGRNVKFRSVKFEGRNVKFRSVKFEGRNVKFRSGKFEGKWKIRSLQCAIGYTKTTSYCSAQNVSKTFCCFFSLSLTLRDRNIPSMHADGAYQGCLSSCKLRSRALTVSRTGKVESSHIDIQIAHVSHAILRLHTLCEIAQRLSYVSQTECR